VPIVGPGVVRPSVRAGRLVLLPCLVPARRSRAGPCGWPAVAWAASRCPLGPGGCRPTLVIPRWLAWGMLPARYWSA